mgnify:CR=1 FL=1
MTAGVPPRIYCIPATEAPIVAVFRRGPTSWSHVGRWDVAAGRYEPGAWLGGRIFPRRSDLSPDGRWLCYFAHKPGATWDHGDAYVALSKLPWLTALHAFRTCGTWTRGYAFTAGGGIADEADVTLPIPYGLRARRATQFECERDRGWAEAPDSPPREPSDAWDERRHARMRKPQPGGHRVLGVERVPAAIVGAADQSVGGLAVRYSLESAGDVEILDDLQWADWDRAGRLLLATRGGRLQIRDLDRASPVTVFDTDLASLDPKPEPPPEWAQRW